MAVVYVEFFGDFNGFVKSISNVLSVKGVSSGIADEISYRAYEDFKDDSRGVFDKANGSSVSVGTKLSTWLYM